MIWQTWRQHRAAALGALAVVAVTGVLAIVSGVPLHRYGRDELNACALTRDPDDWCRRASATFSDHAHFAHFVGAWLPFLPLAAGLLIGAPLLAREFEFGTWQLAWTQSVTKSRWLRSTLALVVGGVTAAALALSAIVSWWFAPLSPNPFIPERFNQGPLVFPSYALLAVGLGIAAGAIVRRTLLAAAITVVAFLAVRLPVEFVLRQHYFVPVKTSNPEAAQTRGWIIDTPGVLSENEWFRYHPAERYWPFQLIEAAIFTGIAVIAIAVAYRVARSGSAAWRMPRFRPNLGRGRDIVEATSA